MSKSLAATRGKGKSRGAVSLKKSTSLAVKKDQEPPRKAASKSTKKSSAKKSAAKKSATKASIPLAKGAAERSAVELGSFAEKHAAKKHAEDVHKKRKHGEGEKHGLERAFHHIERAGAVVALLEDHSGSDLRQLLAEAVSLYRAAQDHGRRREIEQAAGVARACEHVAMGGMYEATPTTALAGGHAPKIEKVQERIKRAKRSARGRAEEWLSMAASILEQAKDEGQRPHLVWELAKAAEGLIDAAEA